VIFYNVQYVLVMAALAPFLYSAQCQPNAESEVILQFFNLLIQNGDVYTAAELPYKQITKSEEDLLDLYLLRCTSKP